VSSLPSEVIAPDGRKFGLRELDPGDMLDLIEAAGSAMNAASAQAWLSYAQIICSVTLIDGVPVQMPGTKDEVKDLARRIGNAGFVALQKAIYPEAEKKKADADDGAPTEEMSVAKN